MARQYVIYGPLGAVLIDENSTRQAPIRGVVVNETSGGAAYSVTLDAGTFALSGNSATLAKSKGIQLAFGGYGVAGASATLRAGRVVLADDGAFALTVASPQPVLRVDAGYFAEAGQPANLIYTPVSTKLIAECGVFDLSGPPVDLGWTRPLAVEAGMFIASGFEVSFTRTRNLHADPGAFVLTGMSAELEAPKIVARPLYAKVIVVGPS